MRSKVQKRIGQEEKGTSAVHFLLERQQTGPLGSGRIYEGPLTVGERPEHLHQASLISL